MIKSKFSPIILLIIISLMAAIVHANVNGTNVVFSEIGVNAPGSDLGNEFVELYNPTANQINIAGWKVVSEGSPKITLTIPAGAAIKAKGYYLIAGKSITPWQFAVKADYNVSFQDIPTTDFGFKLIDTSNQSIDAVGWGSFIEVGYFEGTTYANLNTLSEPVALERKPGSLNPTCGNWQDTDNNVNDFIANSNPRLQNSSMSENNCSADIAAPGSVQNLKSITALTNSITWNWTKPSDEDFSHAILKLNGINVVNTSNSSYTASGLMSNTSYTLSITTADTNGNINTTVVSNTTRTIVNPVACSSNSECNDNNASTTDTCQNAGTVSSFCTHTAITVACSSNSDCGTDKFLNSTVCQTNNVWDSRITFTCNNPGTVGSTCSNSTSLAQKEVCATGCTSGVCNGAVIACTTNSQCNDNNNHTQDACINPGTPSSSCQHLTIACINNNDCGQNAYSGANFCSGKDIVRNFVTNTCTSPNTTSSSCSSSTAPVLNQTCAFNCSNGACVIPIISCNSDSICNDNNPRTFDKCQNPGLPNSTCNYTAIACLSSSDCGTDGLIGDPFCQSVNLFKTMRTYSCLNNGTVNALCNSTDSVGLFQTCAAGCENSTCLTDTDNDTIADKNDNCPLASNINQTDSDSDHIGDVCDVCPIDANNDIDHDGMCEDADMCPVDSNNDLVDQDEVCANVDNCKNFFNDNQIDSNNNGIGDACDCTANPENDKDNDGICDEADRFDGNSNSMSTNPNCVKVYINGVEESDPVGVADVEFKRCDNNQTIVEFTYDFGADSLDITNTTVTFSDSGAGSVIVNNLELGLGAESKTVYVKSVLNSNKLCIKDEANVQDFTVSGDCENGIQILCDGTSGQYSCQKIGDYYKVSGLRHSAVVEYTFTSTRSGSSGGGGGGGGSSGSSRKCISNWECTDWSSCINTYQRRTCVDRNNCNATATNSPETLQRCAGVDTGNTENSNSQSSSSGSGESTSGSEESQTNNQTEAGSEENEGNEISGIAGLTGRVITNLNNLWNSKQKKTIATVILLLLLILFLILFLRSGKNGKNKGPKGKKAKSALFFGLLGITLLLAVTAYAGIGTSVLISEVYYNPVGPDNTEYIELYNPTTSAIDISDWKIYTYSTTSASVVIPSGSFIQPHSFYLIGEHPNTWPSTWAKADTYQRLYLVNSNSGIKLKNSLGQTIDSVGWGSGISTGNFEGTPLANNPADGQSFERKPGYLIASCGNYEDTNNNNADFIKNQHALPWNSSYSEDTCTQDIVAPGQITGLQSISKSNVSITWTWNNPVDEDFKTALILISGNNVANTTTGTYTLSGLTPSTLYIIEIKTVDINGNINNNGVSDSQTTLETSEQEKQLLIIGQSISAVTNSSALIEWGTNLDATTQVNYGTSSSLGTSNTIPGSSTVHSVSLTSLLSNTTYYYKITSCFNESLCNSSATLQFKTGTNSILDLTDDLQANYLKARITIDGEAAPEGYPYTVKVLTGNNSGYEFAGTVDSNVPTAFNGNGYLFTNDNIGFSTGTNFRLNSTMCTESVTGTFANGGNGDFTNESSLLLLACTSPPAITQAYYLPSNPTDTDDIIIYADANDNHGISIVKVMYSVNNGTTSDMTMDLDSGLYSANIGKFQPNDSVKFYVSVEDDYTNTVTSDNTTIIIDQIDNDQDGVWDQIDNCVGTNNSDQIDTDGDGKGDACDPAECADNADNDADNLIDLEDPGCDNATDNNETDECYTDFDCSQSNKVYCLSDAVANDAGKCVNSKCVVDTEIVDDCGGKVQLQNECGAEQWSCHEANQTATCILDEVVADNDLCSDECFGTELRQKSCNQTTFSCDSVSTECADQNDFTEDLCVVNDIHNSSCTNTPIQCFTADDCGVQTVSSICDDSLNNIINITTPACMQAGTTASYCVNESTVDTLQCNNICSEENHCDYTACSDGVDNDNDGFTDFPSDLGCGNFTDNDESDGFVACTADSDCGNATTLHACNALTFMTEITTPTCFNASTEYSYCSNVTNTGEESCTYLCSSELGCDYCTPNMTSTEWNDWTNVTCSLDQMNQTRSRVNYDQNNCGIALFANTTETEYRLVGPEFTNTTWSDWNNITECMPGDYYTQKRNLTQTDVYACAQSTVFNDYQNQTCDYCTPDLTFAEWTDWNNVSCMAGDKMNQTRSRVQYDQNTCGEVDNETFTEYRNTEFCDFCTPSISYTEWSDWNNLTCLAGDKMNQSRTRVAYDANTCGEVDNETITEYRNTESCDFCTPDLTITDWSSWENLTCLPGDTMNQTRNKIQYDQNTCGEVANETFTEYRNTESCDFCTPSISYTEWSDWTDLNCLQSNTKNQSRTRIAYDSNSCGEVANETVTEFRNAESCDYCTPSMTYTDWTEWQDNNCLFGDVMNQTRSRVRYDLNYCGEIQNESFTEERSNGYCDYCTPNMLTIITSDWTNISCMPTDLMNQSRTNVQYDSNYCGEAANITEMEYRAELSCDYCTPNMQYTEWSDWTNTSCQPGNVMNQSRTRVLKDNNQCGEVNDTTETEYRTSGTCSYRQCSDGIDNDNDSYVDYPDDLGCESLDDNNEADGHVSCSANTDCGVETNVLSCNALDSMITKISPICVLGGTERSYCTNQSTIVSIDHCNNICSTDFGCDYTQCSDSEDNDLDGHADYPSDKGCDNFLDNNEADGTISCSADVDCGSQRAYSECSGLSLMTTTVTPMCTNAGTEYSYCSNSTESVLSATCSHICSAQSGCDYTQCSNSIDDDFDSFVDYPSDFGCDNYYDNNEADGSINCTVDTDCGNIETEHSCDSLNFMTTVQTPKCNNGGTERSYCSYSAVSSGQACTNICSAESGCDYTQCSNSIDDDNDSTIDFGHDLGCDNFLDNNEADGHVACSTDANCGSTYNTLTCNTLDLTITTVVPHCINPGLENSRCEATSSNTQQTCSNTCDTTNGCDYIPVSAYITANPERGILPLNVSFAAVANGMGQISYSWDFDASDGIQTQSTDIAPSAIYMKDGNYTVTLTVTTSGGQSLSVSKIIEVLPVPVEPVRLQGQLSVDRIIIGDSDKLKAGDVTRMTVVFRNSGDMKLENVRVQFAIPELGISRTSEPMTISKGNSASKTMEILVPYGVRPGEYTARITVFASESKRVSHRDIIIE